MKTTLEKIAVMQACEEGKTIEIFANDRWEVVIAPLWDWFNADYRVKPETLNEATSKYCKYWKASKSEMTAIKNAFRAGVRWQKGQQG